MRMLGIVALAGALIAGCSADGPITSETPSAPSQAPTLRGTSWVLRNLGGTPALSNADATLTFADNDGVNGRASCNQFSGTATVRGNAITFGPLASTRMACAEPIMRQEQQYLEALGKAERFELSGATLLIFSTGSAQPLQFVAR